MRENKKKRAERRWRERVKYLKRLRDKLDRGWFRRAYVYGGDGSDQCQIDQERIAEAHWLKDTGTPCSCSICRNQRHVSGVDRLTIQELKALDSYKDQLKEDE